MAISTLARKNLSEPVSVLHLVYFRMIFGGIMMWEVYRYISKDWVYAKYIEPEFFFTYPGFGWLHPWTGNGMYYHFYAMGILAFFIFTGFLYRIATSLFFVAFTYVFLLDKTHYLNHFYLVMLISFIMIFLPAHRRFSIDAYLNPNIRSDWSPAWSLWLLRAQLGIVYFFGGVAKINVDWLQAYPIRFWLQSRTDFPIIGQWFTETWMAYLFAYSGLMLDLCITPLLLIKRTRIYAFAVICLFHLMNARLFTIGIFPWFMIGATVIFFDFPNVSKFKSKLSQHPNTPMLSRLGLICLSAYLALQILVPLRHFLFPGNVSWTEFGHRFSWHMKLRSKKGRADFYLINEDNKKVEKIDPAEFLTYKQYRKMKTRPDMILQFAKYLEQIAIDNGLKNISIKANVLAGLNGRDETYLIDPEVDLTKVEYNYWYPSEWIGIMKGDPHP